MKKKRIRLKRDKDKYCYLNEMNYNLCNMTSSGKLYSYNKNTDERVFVESELIVLINSVKGFRVTFECINNPKSNNNNKNLINDE